MKFLCTLKLHEWKKTMRETEKKEIEKGACVETWEVTYNHFRCTQCGKKKKKINKKGTGPHGTKIKDIKLVTREWKEPSDPDEE